MTTRGRNSALPGVLREIADAAGVEAAWALARAHGGTTVYITVAPIKDHWLVELVGWKAAEKICDLFPGHRVLIPLARLSQQQDRLVRSLEAGLSATQAAEAAGMHERTAFRARKRLKEGRGENDDKQFKLL